ncbi:MAG: hypothetical protein J6Q54_08560 [Oscillospiraceae bacterium]|nr:hypothetical protein [Oscillospiraceae bacterium]
MLCKQCGHQSLEDFRFCPNCGAEAAPTQEPPAPENPVYQPPVQEPENPVSQPAPVYEEEPIRLNPAAETFLSILRDKLLLIICILMSVSAAAAVFASELPVIRILLAVFLWFTYAQAEQNSIDHRNLQCVSGTVFAYEILLYVLAAFFGFIGLTWGSMWDLFYAMPEFQSGLQLGIAQSGITQDSSEYGMVMQLLTGGFLSGVFFAIAIGIALYNLFTIRYVHKFIKTFYKSLQDGQTEIRCITATKVVLIVFAVLKGLSALGSAGIFAYMAALSTGAECAVCILGYLLIDKHLKTQQPQ